MTAKPILSDVARAEKVAAVEAELADLVAQGVKVAVTAGELVAVTAGELVALEEQGLVVELTTGRPIVPVFALDRQGAAL